MYREPYNCRINVGVSEKIDKTNEEIAKEQSKGTKSDKRKLLRLYEQKLLQGGMLSNINGPYGKYQNPW